MIVNQSGDIVKPTPQSGPNSAANTAASTGKKLNFLGWGLLLLFLYALNGTSTGHELIYYSMVLIVLFLFINNYNRIMPAITK